MVLFILSHLIIMVVNVVALVIVYTNVPLDTDGEKNWSVDQQEDSRVHW